MIYTNDGQENNLSVKQDYVSRLGNALSTEL